MHTYIYEKGLPFWCVWLDTGKPTYPVLEGHCPTPDFRRRYKQEPNSAHSLFPSGMAVIPRGSCEPRAVQAGRRQMRARRPLPTAPTSRHTRRSLWVIRATRRVGRPERHNVQTPVPTRYMLRTTINQTLPPSTDTSALVSFSATYIYI